MIYYYNVLPVSDSYHGFGWLTYSSPEKLELGVLVKVRLRKKVINGIVISPETNPPKKLEQIIFATKLSLPNELLSLIDWFVRFYPAPLGKVGQLFLPGYLELESLDKKSPIKNKKVTAPQKLPPLTKAQKKVLAEIAGALSRSFLLHGDTGSGKTRIYIELIKEQMAKSKSAILLVPEIALTPQLVQELEKTFADKIILLHSKLSRKTRQEAWKKIINAQNPLVVVGPRSALFAPLSNVGLIAVDEAHEPAYKSEKQPHYQTLRAASALAALHGAKFIAGTATPLISEYYFAKTKKIPVLRLKGLARSAITGSKKITFSDLNKHNQFTRHPIIGDILIKKITENLKNKRQVLLYLNRRGTARVVLCANCSWKAVCPNCALPLVYHSNTYNLRCHTCGFGQSVPTSCPICGQSDLLFKSFGTKAIQEFIASYFPKANVARIDSDSKKAEQAQALYQDIKSNKIDILIGTQIIAKGLDLPSLGLVGVLQADSSLFFPDYTADERTYQLINQVIGRVGRGWGPSEAVIQSYSLNNPTLQQAATTQWDKFYNSQLKHRQKYGYPPFYHVLKISSGRKSKQLIQKHALALAAELSANKNLRIIGPSPKFIEKQSGKYTWQIIIKSKSRENLTKLIPNLPSGWSYDLDPNNLL